MSPRALPCLLVAALLVHSAAAQITEKQAVAQVKAASKTQIKAFKQNGVAALATLDASLKTFEGLITSSSDPDTLVSEVGNAAIAFMTTMNADYFNALDLPPQAAVAALASLADGGDLNGLYPKDLYFGTGGVLDAHRKSMLAAATKVRDAALKRLAKTAALSEKVAGVAMIIELEFPTVVDAESVNQDASGGVNERSRFDVILSASKLGAAHDGVLAFAGATDDTHDDVSLGYDGPNGAHVTDLVAPDAVSGRFSDIFDGLAEGGYVTFARQGDALDFDAVGEIGIR